MDFNSSALKGPSQDAPFDIQGFKNLLDTLKKSKTQQEDKAKPVYNSEE